MPIVAIGKRRSRATVAETSSSSLQTGLYIARVRRVSALTLLIAVITANTPSPWGVTPSSCGTPSRSSRRSGPWSARTHDTATTYGEAACQASTWPAPRRTIIKAEVVCTRGANPRSPAFVITSLRQTPAWIYTHVYCARDDNENRWKELKLAWPSDAPVRGESQVVSGPRGFTAGTSP
jgi:hypothetical protein